MKKTILTTIILLASSGAFASEAFTPIKLTANDAKAQTQVQAPATAEETLGNSNIQNAILQIDNAQVEIRNQLLDLKTKYADVDAQYTAVKAERKTLKKQVSQSEKRLKSLDRAKEKMRKNML
ncbi:MAG: hypothetical protein K6E29_07505 [Cyanobacteria bacterium RUI128]|nr:hypothetical protein [Cyanobacteria bacterium RUI128]